MEGRPQGFVKLEDVQRALSKEPIEVSQAELASLGARERRSVQKKIQQLQVEVDLKDNEIETLSNQLEQRGQRIEVLSKVLEQTQQTTKRGLRHTNEDSYLENLTKMTEQLSTYEISDRAQKNELVKLHAKVKEAETVTEQLDGAIQQMEELETENRMLKEQIARQRIEVLSKVLEQTQQTTKRGLRHTNEDSYLENLTKMTEQLSTYEISDRAQKNELVKLHAKVKEAETVTEQLDGAIQQMEELETENRMLKEQIARQRIEVLSKVLEQTQQTTKRGLRHTNEDSYLENLTKMTEQLSTYEISDRAQKNEPVKLHAKVKEAETVTEQLDGAIQQMEELETENRMLKEQIARQGGGGAREQQHGREVTYQSYNQEVMAELSHFRPFKQEVQRLQKDLEEAKSFQKDAVLYHSQVMTLTTKLFEMEEENRTVLGEYHDLEGSHKVLENEINSLRAQLQVKGAQVGQVVSDRMQRAGGGAAESAEGISQLRRQLDLKEREILKLKSQLAELTSSMKSNPRAQLKDAAIGQSADEPPQLDLPTDMVELQQLLREKDAKIAAISRQLQMFEKTATDLMKIVEHTKGQSRIVKDLRQELARKEVYTCSLLFQHESIISETV